LCQYAKQLGSRLWILEHRFFGLSQPFDDYTIDNLSFLSVDQIVEDIRDFVEQKSNAVQKGNWVVLGAGRTGLFFFRIFKGKRKTQ
jgi:hypothetical protein